MKPSSTSGRADARPKRPSSCRGGLTQEGPNDLGSGIVARSAKRNQSQYKPGVAGAQGQKGKPPRAAVQDGAPRSPRLLGGSRRVGLVGAWLGSRHAEINQTGRVAHKTMEAVCGLPRPARRGCLSLLVRLAEPALDLEDRLDGVVGFRLAVMLVQVRLNERSRMLRAFSVLKLSANGESAGLCARPAQSRVLGEARSDIVDKGQSLYDRLLKATRARPHRSVFWVKDCHFLSLAV